MTMRWMAVAAVVAVAAIETKAGSGAVRAAMEPAGFLLLGTGVVGGAVLRGRVNLLDKE